METVDELDVGKERAALVLVIQEHHRSIDAAKRKMRENPNLKNDHGQWTYCAALEGMLARCERRLAELTKE